MPEQFTGVFFFFKRLIRVDDVSFQEDFDVFAFEFHDQTADGIFLQSVGQHILQCRSDGDMAVSLFPVSFLDCFDKFGCYFILQKMMRPCLTN